MPVDAHCMAYTPPPTALNPVPNPAVSTNKREKERKNKISCYLLHMGTVFGHFIFVLFGRGEKIDILLEVVTPQPS